MKKNFLLVFMLLFSIAASQLFAFRQTSYRSQATQGFFLQEFDRMFTNPAYLGAKLDYLEFQNSITGNRTNVFTHFNNLNTDGTLLVGGIGKLAGMTMGGIIEGGYTQTPQTLTLNQTHGNVTLDLTNESGFGEASEVFFDGDSTDEDYLRKELIEGEQDFFTNTPTVNTALAVGNIAAAPLGILLEVDTDGTIFTNNTSSYTYTRTRLTDDFELEKITNESQTITKNNEVDYNATIGYNLNNVLAIKAMCNLLTKNSNTETTSKTEDIDNGLQKTNTTTTTNNQEVEDGLQLGLGASFRQPLGPVAAEFGINYLWGGLNDNHNRTDESKTVVENTVADNSEYVNKTETTTKVVYEGPGVNQHQVGLDLLFRTKLFDAIDLGTGLRCSYSFSQSVYDMTVNYEQVQKMNDGDGVEDADDYTDTTTYSYIDTVTLVNNIYSISWPIGLEYKFLPRLALRLGANYTNSLTVSENYVMRKDVKELYRDRDRDDIEGNEDYFDGKTNNDSQYANDPANRELTFTWQDTKSFNVGLGWAVTDNFQLDFVYGASALAAGQDFTMGLHAISLAGTFVF